MAALSPLSAAAASNHGLACQLAADGAEAAGRRQLLEEAVAEFNRAIELATDEGDEHAVEAYKKNLERTSKAFD
ncbi:hypothetical protein [Aestuariimicrobium sp. Y1814]|uniref:hypothetical protein n=1 Tax=Aestuariimicrobium sp. Y1814 TaxID=3418742 RepID=UPI003DA778F8